jgi:hypothetical protein
VDDEQNILMENSKHSPSSSGLDQLLPVLREGLYHITDEQGYDGILSSRYIKPNTGEFPDSSSKSAHSYGRSSGYISLFDFETPTLEQCVSEKGKWTFFFVQQKPFLVLIEIDRRKLGPKLMPNEKAKEEVGYGKPVWMPHVEVWYPDPIPFSWIKRFIHIIPTPSVRFEIYSSTEGGMEKLKRAQQKAKESYIHEDEDEIVARVLGLSQNSN